MNVGVVLVSHSGELVEGLKKILQQVQPEVQIGIAGGTDEGEIGTSAIRIKEAIESVASDQGVVLLFDLGSALMNAELAVEMLNGAINVVFCDAPLVEGGYTAVVEAGCGSTLEEVVQAAESAKQIPKLM